jgi:hypothetical protein
MIAEKIMLAFIISVALVFNSFSIKAQPVQVAGVVLSGQSGKPLSNIHVYIVEGEEEDVTNSNGEFKIQTWQKFPLRVTATSSIYERVTVVVKDASTKLVIKLKPKQ